MAASITELKLPVMTPMQRLALANDRLAELKAEAKRWQAEYDGCLEAVLASAPKFERSRFLRATGGKGDAYQADHVSLIRTPVVKRIIRQDEFIEKYPKEFMQIGVVTIKDAEAAIGKDRLMELCDLSTDYRYKVVRTGAI
jgi:hypothetical protein